MRKISLDNTQLFLLQQNQEHVNKTQGKEIPLMDFSPVCKSEFWTFQTFKSLSYVYSVCKVAT